LGLLITAGFVVIEAFVEPLLVDGEPELVTDLLRSSAGPNERRTWACLRSCGRCRASSSHWDAFSSAPRSCERGSCRDGRRRCSPSDCRSQSPWCRCCLSI